MTALTITPKDIGDQTLYSDGGRSNRIIIHVERNNAPLAETSLTGTLTDAKGNPAGAVIPGSTDPNGDFSLGATLVKDGKLTLTLTADAQSSGTTIIYTIKILPVTFVNTPAVARAGAGVNARAQIAITQFKAVGGIPLNWHVLDRQLDIPDLYRVTDTQRPASFTFSLPALTPEQIATLNNNRVNLQLTIGAFGKPAGDFITVDHIPVSPALLAPYYAIAPDAPAVINDGVIAACPQGIPFGIPVIANAVLGDLIVLYSSPDGNDADATPLLAKELDFDAIGSPFLMFVPTRNSAFALNGPKEIFYKITLSRLGGAETASGRLQLQVDRRNTPESPDGNPDHDLTVPDVTPVSYTVDNYNQTEEMTITVNFNGTFIPQIGDVITVKIYLLGYTQANLNWVKKIDNGKGFTLMAANFDKNGRFKPYTVAFAAGEFKGVDGSNGQAYFVLQRGAAAYRSPSRQITVDTVAAYSSS